MHGKLEQRPASLPAILLQPLRSWRFEKAFFINSFRQHLVPGPPVLFFPWYGLRLHTHFQYLWPAQPSAGIQASLRHKESQYRLSYMPMLSSKPILHMSSPCNKNSSEPTVPLCPYLVFFCTYGFYEHCVILISYSPGRSQFRQIIFSFTGFGFKTAIRLWI